MWINLSTEQLSIIEKEMGASGNQDLFKILTDIRMQRNMQLDHRDNVVLERLNHKHKPTLSFDKDAVFSRTEQNRHIYMIMGWLRFDYRETLPPHPNEDDQYADNGEDDEDGETDEDGEDEIVEDDED